MDHKKGDTGANPPQSSDQLRATPDPQTSLHYHHHTGVIQIPQNRAKQNHGLCTMHQNHQRGKKSYITPTLSCRRCLEGGGRGGGDGGGSPGSSLSEGMGGCVSTQQSFLPWQFHHPRWFHCRRFSPSCCSSTITSSGEQHQPNSASDEFHFKLQAPPPALSLPLTNVLQVCLSLERAVITLTQTTKQFSSNHDLFKNKNSFYYYYYYQINSTKSFSYALLTRLLVCTKHNCWSDCSPCITLDRAFCPIHPARTWKPAWDGPKNDPQLHLQDLSFSDNPREGWEVTRALQICTLNVCLRGWRYSLPSTWSGWKGCSKAWTETNILWAHSSGITQSNKGKQHFPL